MIYTVTINPAVDKTAEVETIVDFGLNRLTNVKLDAGGKGINVSKTIKELQGESIALGFIAGSTGEFIKHELDQRNIQHDFIETSGNTRTNLKVIDAQARLTEFNEQGPAVTDEEIQLLINRIKNNLKENDILILSGSVCQGVSKSIYRNIMEECSPIKSKVILDAEGELFEEGLNGHPTLVKPNLYELCKYLKIPEDTAIDVVLEKSKILFDQGIKMIVLSMGADGAIYLIDGKVYECKALKINVHSSVGAGDAMVAALAVSLDQGKEIDELIRLSMASGAGACLTKGTDPASFEVVIDLMKQVVIQEREG